MSDFNPIEKRDVLFGVKKMSASELNRIAGDFEAKGHYSDAGDFYHQTKNTQALQKLRQKSVEEGDTFLFGKLSRYLNDADQVTAELQACSEAAERLGKFRYAIKGFEKLGNTDRVEEIKSKIATDGDILAEAASTVFIPHSEEEEESAEEGDEE